MNNKRTIICCLPGRRQSELKINKEIVVDKNGTLNQKFLYGNQFDKSVIYQKVREKFAAKDIEIPAFTKFIKESLHLAVLKGYFSQNKDDIKKGDILLNIQKTLGVSERAVQDYLLKGRKEIMRVFVGEILKNRPKFPYLTQKEQNIIKNGVENGFFEEKRKIDRNHLAELSNVSKHSI